MYQKANTSAKCCLQIIENWILLICPFSKRLENTMLYNRLVWETYENHRDNHVCSDPEPLRCLSEDASQMSPQRAMPLMCSLNEIYAPQMPPICLLNERCFSYASSKNFRNMKCLILGMRATCIIYEVYFPWVRQSKTKAVSEIIALTPQMAMC